MASSKQLNIMLKRLIAALQRNSSNSADDVRDSKEAATTARYEAITEAIRELTRQLQTGGKVWKDYQDVAVRNVRTIGLAVRDVQDYQSQIMAATKEMVKDYAVSIEEVNKFQSNIATATNRAQILNRQEMDDMAAVTSVLGEETTNELAKGFDNIGASLETAYAHGMYSFEMAKRYGLNAKEASATFAKNIKLASSYTFSGGIQGLTKMTLLSQKLKFDMNSITSAAEKFSTIEGAIKTAANIQMLGGNIGAMFSNPMDVMYEALNDMEGFTERIVSSVAQKGRFDARKGVVEISPIDKRMLREYAQQMGMNADELINMTNQSAKNAAVEAQLRGNYTEEQKAYITSQAKYDADTKKFYIEGEYNPETKQRERIYTDKLTPEMAKELQNIAAPEEAIRGDVADIADIMRAHFKKEASQIRSAREMESGITESWYTGIAELIDPIMRGYTDILKSVLGDGLLGKAFDFFTNGKLWGTGVGVAGLAGLIGLKAGATVKVNEFWRGLFGLGRKTPLQSPPGGNNGNKTSSLGGIKAEGDVTKLKEKPVQKPEEGAKPSSGKTSKWQKAKAAIAKTWKKIPKGGKKGIIGAAITAGVALATYAGYKAGKGGEEGAEPQNQPLGGVNIGECTNCDILIELQKQTALLEAISGKKAEDLVPKIESANIANNGGHLEGTVPGAIMGTAETAIGGVYDAQLGLSATKWLGGSGGAISQKVGNTIIGKGANKLLESSAGRLAGKTLSKTTGKLALGAMKGGGIGLAADLVNLGGQTFGLWEEGSHMDKGLNIASNAATGAMIGSVIPVIGTTAGAIAGALYGVANQYGEQILEFGKKGIAKVKSVAKSAFTKGKELLFGSSEKNMSEKDKAQAAFETTKLGITDINDPQLIQKAALATIGIHDLLISKWNVDNGKLSNGQDKKTGLLQAPLKAVGAYANLVKGTWGMVGKVASGALSTVGSIFGISGKKSEAEQTLAQGVSIDDPQLMQKAALATIGIHEIVSSRLGKIGVNRGLAKGVSRIFSPFRMINDIREVGLNAPGLWRGRVPEVSSPSFFGNLISSVLNPTPLGSLASNILPRTAENTGIGGIAGQRGIGDINLNVTGTIRLEGSNGNAASVDANSLLNNKKFVDNLVRVISDAFQKNVNMGVGANRNNPARNNIGNTDVLAGRRR